VLLEACTVRPSLEYKHEGGWGGIFLPEQENLELGPLDRFGELGEEDHKHWIKVERGVDFERHGGRGGAAIFMRGVLQEGLLILHVREDGLFDHSYAEGRDKSKAGGRNKQ